MLGPLKLLKEKFLSEEEEEVNLLQYVLDFRARLVQVGQLARENLVHVYTQRLMKKRYDKRVTNRKFIPGDKVLVLLPVHGKPLQAKYFGPYTIEEKVCSLNYVVTTPDRRKRKQICHINMLKLYVDRDNTDNTTATKTVCPVTQANAQEESINDQAKLHGMPKLQNSNVLLEMYSKLTHLPPYHLESLKSLIDGYTQSFPHVPSQTGKIYPDVDVGDASPIKQSPYRMSPLKKKYLQKEVQYLLDNNLIEPSQSCWSSPCILIPKPDGSFRLYTDYRKINNITKTDTFPIPRFDDCIDNIGNAKFVTKLDLLKGFWQVPLTARAKEISAFVTCEGLYQYKVMPFSMKNAPATFQRLINKVITGLGGCEAYIDDVIVYSDSWETYLEILEELFDRLSEANLTVNLMKSEFGCGTVTYLGHEVGQGQVSRETYSCEG